MTVNSIRPMQRLPQLAATLTCHGSIEIKQVFKPLLQQRTVDLWGQRPEIVVAASIMSVIATIAVALRLLARRVSRTKLEMDAWLIMGALAEASGCEVK